MVVLGEVVVTVTDPTDKVVVLKDRVVDVSVTVIVGVMVAVTLIVPVAMPEVTVTVTF